MARRVDRSERIIDRVEDKAEIRSLHPVAYGRDFEVASGGSSRLETNQYAVAQVFRRSLIWVTCYRNKTRMNPAFRKETGKREVKRLRPEGLFGLAPLS